jgi:type II secretory pathway pseudopilin PulG
LNYWVVALILIAALAVVAVARVAGRRRTAVRLDAGAVSEQWLAESRREEEA